MDVIHYCPHCGKSYYMVRYSMATCLGWPQIYKDGMLLYSNPNVTTRYCHCLDCGQDFSFEE